MRALSLVVVGADHPNKTGPLRRFEIAMCKPGEVIDLVLEPKNPADPNAVAVFTARNIQIGYVSAERAPLIGNAIRRGIVTAIFQHAAPWGAVVRAHLDGSEAELPAVAERGKNVLGSEEDQDWWPDAIWEED